MKTPPKATPIFLPPRFGPRLTPEPVSTISGTGAFRLDLSVKCGFGCLYCSSNCSKELKRRTPAIQKASLAQCGRSLNPLTEAHRFGAYYQNPIESLERQLFETPSLKRIEQTLQLGILTDAFDPYLVKSGVTLQALSLLLKETRFKVRILTKSNAFVRPEFVSLFVRHKKRIIVGVSCSTYDSAVAKAVELRTSTPRARAQALITLQEEGLSTYAMFCPVLPGTQNFETLHSMYSQFRPQKLKELWAEPYLDPNWSYFHKHLTTGDLRDNIRRVMKSSSAWAQYVFELALNHRLATAALGFKGKGRVLIYGPSLSAAQKKALKTRGLLFE